MTYRSEFGPQFGYVPEVFLSSEFADESWHNDACPSFRHIATRTVVFVDAQRRADREWESAPRYSAYVAHTTQAGDVVGMDDVAFQSDDLELVLAWVRASRAVVTD